MTKEEIKDIRVDFRLTQAEFAKKLKVDSITISRWERGTQRPTLVALRQMERLARKGRKNGDKGR